MDTTRSIGKGNEGEWYVSSVIFYHCFHGFIRLGNLVIRTGMDSLTN